MKMGSIPELSTQTLLLFDLQIPVTKAKEDVWNLEKAISGMGLKISRIEYGPTLLLNGQVIENPLCNKMLLTLVKRRVNEDAFSAETQRDYLKFLEGKVCPDPPTERSNG